MQVMHRSAIVVVCSVCRTQNKHNATDRESFYHVANACGIHIWEGESVLPGAPAMRQRERSMQEEDRRHRGHSARLTFALSGHE
jgi:hypothetical protein